MMGHYLMQSEVAERIAARPDVQETALMPA